MSEPGPAPEVGQPRMSQAERAHLLAVLEASRGLDYLEFGMGGSTLLAVQKGLANIVAVDSAQDWVQALGRHPAIAEAVAAGRVSLLHGDIGPVGPWGRPEDKTKKPLWPNYVMAPWQEVGRRGMRPDLVLVDGRFRVACAVSVALAAREARGGQGPRIFVHDVSPKRPAYDAIEEVLAVVEKVQTLWEYRIRPEVPAASALALMLRHQFAFI